jgi:serine/threonine protein kinase
MFVQVGKGLDSLHYLGYVHCDVKPNNILTNDKKEVKIIDFGQAAKAATVKERIQGTPDFIAPEQVEKRPVTVRTDVYNFGATLYWAVARHRIPTLYNIRKHKREALRDEHIKPPTHYNPEVPEALSDLIMECIHLDPTERPRNMGDVVKGLEELRGIVK